MMFKPDHPTRIYLNGNDWLFKDFYGEDWRWRKSYEPGTSDYRWWRKGTVPGSVQHDLWKLGELNDPYFEQNTLLAEWVSQRSWLYKKSFSIPVSLKNKRLQLVFKGVDYAADFYLNGVFLGSHTGMFTPVKFDVGGKILFDSENLIAVAIQPAPQEQPQVGYTSQVSTHKGRMGYWWDFSPRVVHLGIWDDVYLEISETVRIEDVFVQPNYQPDMEIVPVSIEMTFDSVIKSEIDLEINLFQAGSLEQTLCEHIKLSRGESIHRVAMDISKPKIWWPNGYGKQPLYQAQVKVHTNQQISFQKTVSFGIRHIELVPNQDAETDALPYTLVVNGRRMYMRGWNWVPMDVLYGVPRPEKLKRLLTLVKEAHVNILRVWGGGLIEKEDFYDLCDQYGILVWQEFIQSSSGIDNNPSTDPAFIALLKQEAEQIIPLKRNHASLALWCGGNELQSGSEQPLNDSHPTLAALKAVVKRLDPDRLWLATSPTGRVFSNSFENIQRDPTALHDVHGPWEYQGTEKQYVLFNQGTSLIHTEFGVEGITNPNTLDKTIRKEKQWPISLDSNRYWWHLGAWWVRRVVWDQVFGDLPDVETYTKATQFTQYDGLKYALEANRRRKYHNSGSLPWQFNEPYPMAACTSAVDYYAQPKPVYYAVKKAYKDLTLSALFDQLTWPDKDHFQCQVWLVNAGLKEMDGLFLSTSLLDVNGTELACKATLLSYGQDEAIRLQDFQSDLNQASTVFFLDLQLKNNQQKLLASNRYVFTRDEKLTALLSTPPAELEVNHTVQEDQWTIAITNTGNAAVMSLWLSDERNLPVSGFVYFSDNYVFLFPKETITITARWEQVPPEERCLRITGWNTNQILLREGDES
jgi:beta-mannosidase